MTKTTDSQPATKFVRTHYVADTNFLLDYPNLSLMDGWNDHFDWPDEPFVLVITDVALAELDRLKHTGTDDIKHSVRKVTASMESVLKNSHKLVNNGYLKIFGNDRTQRGDMNLLERARQYALTVPDEKVVILTSDNLFRLRCHDSGVECVNPEEIEERAEIMTNSWAAHKNEIDAAKGMFPELSELVLQEDAEKYIIAHDGMVNAPLEKIQEAYEKIAEL